MRRVKDLFINLRSDVDLVVEKIMELFDTTADEEKEIRHFIQEMIIRSVKVKDNDNIVSVIVYNHHQQNYTVDAVLIKPGIPFYFSVDYADWDEVLGAYFVTETSLVDTLAVIIFLMTMLSYDEEERKSQISVLKEM